MGNTPQGELDWRKMNFDYNFLSRLHHVRGDILKTQR